MPFVPTEIPQCPKCGKNVYAAEERVAGGKKWHKQCFKCGLCNKGLDSTNCAEHDNQLYCKVCHARKFGPKGYGFGGGAGALSMDKGEHLGNQEAVSNKPHSADYKPVSKAPEGEGCPRCGGYVYAAEQMLARGRAWHKKCYKCKDCTKGLDSTNTCEGPDNDIYCKVCYGKNFGPKGYGYGQGAGALQSDAVAASNTEKTRPTLPNTAAIKAPDGQGCPRCGGAVYAAEQMLARGSMWHKGCFNCKECHRVLDSVLACDGPDRDVYCKLCYAKKYGPKGYGFGGGSAFLMSDTIPNGVENDYKPTQVNTAVIKAADGKGCPRCGGMVFAAEQMLSKGKEWHKGCFNCGDCHRPLDSVLACDGPDNDIYCKACYGKKFGPKGFGYGHMPTLVSVTGETEAPSEVRPGIKAAEGEGCPRCGFAVYAAEQMVCKNRMWHRRCFNCADCHRSLDSTNLNDAPDCEIYCGGCYRKKWGPHGIGYGIGAGTLTMS